MSSPGASSDADRSVIVFREVTAESWKDLEDLFERRGSPKSCWCMVWRATSTEARHTDGKSRKRAMKERVDAGTPVGLLGYLDGVPVAWCSIAPRCTYRAGLAGAQPDDARENVWSVVCFFVEREHRGQGMFRELLDAARRHAMDRGATILEAYPVDEDSPSYRFGGFFPAFEKAGFVEAGRAGSRRRVVRLRLV